MPSLYSSAEVGRLIGADASSVNRWIDGGKLLAHRTPGGHRRVRQEDLLSFLEQHGLPVPDELRPAEQSTLILICDSDERQLRSLSRGLLRERTSLQVVSCSSPLQGLLKLGIYRPQLALLDALMPGLDWADVCRTVLSNAETQGMRVLGCATRPSPTLERRLRDAGALALLAKPVRAADLLGWL